MKILLVSLPLVVACGNQPSKEDSLKIVAATTAAMTTTRTDAVASARNAPHAAPSALTLDFHGACATGGTVAVTGAYDDSGSGSSTTFDLQTTFDHCGNLGAALDGDMQWSSVADGTRFDASLTGALDYTDARTTASCDFDLHLTVGGAQVGYRGTACGYDAQVDLKLGF